VAARLSPRNARTFYAAADALAPPDGGPGAGDVDLAPALDARLAGWGAARRTSLLAFLVALEALPRLAGRGGFSWLPRADRARLLARVERWPLPGLRGEARRLRELVAGLWREAQSRGGP
jgi:hypothetical protein